MHPTECPQMPLDTRRPDKVHVNAEGDMPSKPKPKAAVAQEEK